MVTHDANFQIVNWTPTTSPSSFNPCTNTLFIWTGGQPPFTFRYTVGNLAGGCSTTLPTRSIWWPIDAITGFANTTEYGEIDFTLGDSVGDTTELIRPFAFSDLRTSPLMHIAPWWQGNGVVADPLYVSS